jgi:epoxide hydrolase-like predicted phosphatase
LLHLSAKRIERQFFQGKERNQELLDYAESLRTRYKIGLLSNLGGDMMDGFFAPAEREKFFDTVVLSGEVRMAKPDPEIFELTCERLGVEPAEAVMVDDVAGNCEAARSVGMGAVCYEHFAQMKTELETLLAA